MNLTLTRPLTALDLETTSPNPKDARIVSLSFTKYFSNDDGCVVPPLTWTHRFNPGVPIPAGATEKHGLTDADVASEPAFAPYAANLAKGFTECDFLGYNVLYDLEVLREEFLRAGVLPTWTYDDAAIVDGFRNWQVLEPRTLTDAVRHWCDRAPTAAHTADGDVQDVLDVVQAQVIAKFGGRGETTPRDLHNLIYPPVPGAVDRGGRILNVNGTLIVNFGKYKGRPLAATDRRYLKWVVAESSMAADLKAIIDGFLKGQAA